MGQQVCDSPFSHFVAPPSLPVINDQSLIKLGGGGGVKKEKSDKFKKKEKKKCGVFTI